jgi:hypothetical protein
MSRIGPRTRHITSSAVLVAAVAGLVMAATPAWAGDFYYWYGLPTSRVLRNALPRTKAGVPTAPLASLRSVGPTLSLSAAGAEYEGRQVVIRPVGSAVTGLVLEPSDLVRVDDSTPPAPAPPTIAAAEISVYRVFYVHIRHPSYGTRARAGWYPDALPTTKRYNDGKAIPQTAYAGLAQPYYVLVHVPDGTPKGLYLGTLTLRADPGTPPLVVPLSVRVYGFSIAKHTLKTSFGLEMRAVKHWSGVKSHGVDAWPSKYTVTPDIESRLNGSDTMARQVTFMGQHRLSPQTISPAFGRPAYEDFQVGPPTRLIFPATNGNSWLTRKDFLDDFLGTGQATTYQGDRLDLTSIRVPDGTNSSSALKNPFASSAARSAAIAYFRWIGSSVGSDNMNKVIAYTIDEPSTSQRSFVSRYGAFVHQYFPGAKFLVTVDPQRFSFRAIKNVDIYVQKMHFWYRDLRTWINPLKRSGKRFWFYAHATAAEQYTPLYLIDKPISDSRIIPWFAYRTNVDGILYFNVSRWLAPVKNAKTFRDPYADPLSGKNPWIANGDGSMTYPGFYPGYVPGTQYSSAGLGHQPAIGLTVPGATLTSSLRMESLRDGLEDYEYLKLLEAKEGRTAAMNFVARCINPKVTVFKGFPAYTKNGGTIASVRDAIAQELEK